MNDQFRIAFAAHLSRSADTLERLAAHLTAADPTKQESLEEMQAQVEAGAAIWASVLRGFLTAPEIVGEVDGLTGDGFTEVDETTDNGVHCANLLFAVMREYFYPLGPTVAPYYALLNDEHWQPSDDEQQMLRRTELRNEATCCRMLAHMVGTAATPTVPTAATLPAATVNDARDKWVYEQCCELVRYSCISRKVGKKTEWEPLPTVQAVRNAAIRYAAAHHLSPIPSRQPGRPARKK